jgi:hypothetical protein
MQMMRKLIAITATKMSVHFHESSLYVAAFVSFYAACTYYLRAFSTLSPVWVVSLTTTGIISLAAFNDTLTMVYPASYPSTAKNPSSIRARATPGLLTLTLYASAVGPPENSCPY